MDGSRKDVAGMYARRFSDVDRESKAALWKVLVESFLQQWFRPQDLVLDLGCGYGEFLNNLNCRRKIGVDLNPDCVKYLRPEVQFREGNVCDLAFLEAESVDRVFSSNLIEHLPGKSEVEAMLREVARVLVPGGELLLIGPNLRFLPGVYWDFWDHQVPITDRSVVEVLEICGLDVVECIPRFLPYTTRSALPKSAGLLRAYLKMPFLWPVFGRQFMVRARKKAG